MKKEINLCKGILSMFAREFDLNRKTMEEAQRATKTIYTFHAGGLMLGYGFGWYKNGPYSDDLSNDLIKVLRDPKYNMTKDKNKWNFSDETRERITEINNKFIAGKSLRELELMTSMNYMWTTWRNEETPYEMKQFFRKKHRDATFGDDSPITDDQLQEGLIQACNLIAYENYHKRLIKSQ